MNELKKKLDSKKEIGCFLFLFNSKDERGFIFNNPFGSADILSDPTIEVLMETYFEDVVEPLEEKVGVHDFTGSLNKITINNKNFKCHVFGFGSYEIKKSKRDEVMNAHLAAFINMFGAENVGKIFSIPVPICNSVHDEEKVKYLYNSL